MAIRFRCPRCGRKIEIAERHAGRTVDCPRCSQPMIVPAATTLGAPRPEPDEPVTARVESRRLAEAEIATTPPVEWTAVPEEEPAPEFAPEPASQPLAARRPRQGAAPIAAEHDAPLAPPPGKIDFEDLIDMTAMVDIVFFLLIFFLVTSMHALDSTIPMPVPDPQAGEATGGAGAAQAALDGDDSQIVVRIDRNDTISVEGAEVHGPQELLFRLRDLRGGPGQPDKLLVLGSGDASHGTAVMVLDAGHEVGMEQVRLAIQDEAE